MDKGTMDIIAPLVSQTIGREYFSAQDREKEEAKDKEAKAEAKAKADADAKAIVDAKAAKDAQDQEDVRRLAELRLARRSRAMDSDTDTEDAARLRLG